jgi:hypothetical protein
MWLGFSDWPKCDFKAVFEQEVRPHSAEEQRPYSLTVTWGLSIYDPAKPRAIATLIKRAEAQARPKFCAPTAA